MSHFAITASFMKPRSKKAPNFTCFAVELLFLKIIIFLKKFSLSHPPPSTEIIIRFPTGTTFQSWKAI
ncbi:hypothetical protein L1987_63057 [Smallanthus sonchifolius]|uniref:Uncharacterized protein n=1 Tax=Smallanthus sonchifolius TaxID=185202 RepID=A0ACB9CCB5_9ASTR|nr:hypothetical protein L1987_63057 [Smallanthus sonchifolius]